MTGYYVPGTLLNACYSLTPVLFSTNAPGRPIIILFL